LCAGFIQASSVSAGEFDFADHASVGACSFCSINQIEAVHSATADWTKWPPVPHGVFGKSCLSHANNLMTRSSRKVAKTISLPTPLKTVGFAPKAASPNWNFPAYVPTADWNFSYVPRVMPSQPALSEGEVHTIKSLKKEVKPITTKKVITIASRLIDRIANSTRTIQWINVVNLDQRVFDFVRLTENLSERWLHDSMAVNSITGHVVAVDEIGLELGSAFNRIMRWKQDRDQVQLLLPESEQGDAYWQYYGDCDHWNVLINTALDVQTFEQPKSESSDESSTQPIGVVVNIPQIVVSIAAIIGGKDVGMMIPKTDDLIRQAKFIAIESSVAGPRDHH
jgi:hypothetical protein